MTRFLRYLGDEIPCNILLHSVRDVSRWYASLDEIGVTHISEIDRKDQFNKIPPTTVLSHIDAASAWLTKRRRWRAKEIVWSIHKDHKQLDRAGQGASGKFWYMTHEDPCAVLKFEMSKNTYVQANGKVWGRGHCIPMGGSFSAQSADLHSCWGLYQARRFLRSLGSLHFTSAGFPYWVNQQGCVSLCQFRDNVLIASNYGDNSHTRLVHDMCTALGEAWNLRVLCDCMADDTQCNRSCVSHGAKLGEHSY